MPISGKFVGPGIYIEELDETHSYKEINNLSLEEFKMITSFMNEKELDRLNPHVKGEYLSTYLLSVLSKI